FFVRSLSHAYCFHALLFILNPPLRDPHSFPTRRSSDLPPTLRPATLRTVTEAPRGGTESSVYPLRSRCRIVSASTGIGRSFSEGDRKSTRLNSSHVSISYAVFCLNKKRVDELIDISVYA